jgi:hypothetical protein
MIIDGSGIVQLKEGDKATLLITPDYVRPALLPSLPTPYPLNAVLSGLRRSRLPARHPRQLNTHL